MKEHFQKILEKNKNNPLTFLVRNGKVAALLGITTCILGLFSLNVIPKESQPNIEFGQVVITTPYSGVNAADIDSLITQKIESKIQSVSSIKTYSSTSESGSSRITIEFSPGVNMLEAVSDIRSKVDEAKGELPSDIDADPVIMEIDTSLTPFIEVLISGPLEARELGVLGEKLKTRVESLPGVSGVTLSKADTEFHINVDKDSIDSLGISLKEIQDSIRSAHADAPIGDLEIEGREYSIRFQGKLKTVEDIKNISIINISEGEDFPRIVLLKDIATVSEEEKEGSVISRFSKGGEDAKNAISLLVSRSGGSDIFAADIAVKEEVGEFITDNLSFGLEVFYANEGAKVMKDDFSELFQNATISVSVVLLLIFFFVGLREGLIAAMVIPLAFLLTVFSLFVGGKTMNFMTNFSMILAIGILVDTAIVIVEGAHDFLKKGFSPKEAAILSFVEFRGPLFSGMSTTIVVFFPLFFLPDVLGKFLAYIPITVTIVLISTLFISLFLIPAYASFFLHSEYKPGKFRVKINAFFDAIISWYERFLLQLLPKRKTKWVLFLMMFGAFFASFMLPIPFDQFPSSDSDSINITLEKDIGIPSDQTLESTLAVENELLSLPETKLIKTSVNGNTADVYVELLPMKEREEQGMRTSKELQFFLTEQWANITDSRIRIKPESNGPPSEFPIGYRIVMDDSSLLEEGKNIAQELTELLEKEEGTQGVNNNIKEIPGEYRFTIDRARVLKLGVPPDSIASTVRTALFGSTVATITRDGLDIDLRVQFPEEQISSIEDLKSIKITRDIPLRDLVHIEKVEALSEIQRYNGKLMFRVSSLLGEGGNAADITAQFSEKIGLLENGEGASTLASSLPSGIRIEDASEAAESSALYDSLSVAGVLAILMIFTILVIQFNSFSQPLLILMTILLAQIGVSIGLYITDTPRSLAFILGVISLAGIVVNDAIIMVDKMNKNIASHAFINKFEAIAQAGKSRFIPVVLTTLTTCAGVIPLIFVDAFWAGLSYTIVFGLSLASFLTLILIPVGYTLFWKRTDHLIVEEK